MHSHRHTQCLILRMSKLVYSIRACELLWYSLISTNNRFTSQQTMYNKGLLSILKVKTTQRLYTIIACNSILTTLNILMYSPVHRSLPGRHECSNVLQWYSVHHQEVPVIMKQCDSKALCTFVYLICLTYYCLRCVQWYNVECFYSSMVFITS